MHSTLKIISFAIMKRWFGIFVLIAAVSCSHRDGKHFDVIVAGGGASGVCAGIQAAPCGAVFFWLKMCIFTENGK